VKQIPSGNASERLGSKSNDPTSSVSNKSSEIGETYVNHEHGYAAACVNVDLSVASNEFF